MALNKDDQDFLDKMVPHHQDAVMMAHHVLSHGSDPRVRKLAGNIIKSQTAEIQEMMNWGAKPNTKSGGTGGPAAMGSKMRSRHGEPEPMHDEELEASWPGTS